jgi:hypothetical protein
VSDDPLTMDWRYFYQVNNIGFASCGLAQRNLAGVLNSLSKYNQFLSPAWMAQLLQSGGNPSTLGFYLEKMVISSLAVCGCNFDEAGVFKNGKLRL